MLKKEETKNQKKEEYLTTMEGTFTSEKNCTEKEYANPASKKMFEKVAELELARYHSFSSI